MRKALTTKMLVTGYPIFPSSWMVSSTLSSTLGCSATYLGQTFACPLVRKSLSCTCSEIQMFWFWGVTRTSPAGGS